MVGTVWALVCGFGCIPCYMASTSPSFSFNYLEPLASGFFISSEHIFDRFDRLTWRGIINTIENILLIILTVDLFEKRIKGELRKTVIQNLRKDYVTFLFLYRRNSELTTDSATLVNIATAPPA